MTKAEAVFSKFAGVHESALAYVARLKANEAEKGVKTFTDAVKAKTLDLKAQELAQKAIKNNVTTG